MATIPLNGPQGRRAKAPITHHPAFPAVVALWFAALLGLGSMVLPSILLEKAVEMTGLASLIPAAAPPLGFTARAAIGAVAALAGTGLGFALARRIAAPVQAEDACRPFQAREDLAFEGVASPVAKRRALAMADENCPSEFLNPVPLPGHDPWAQPAAALDAVAEQDAPAAPVSFASTSAQFIEQELPAGSVEDDGFAPHWPDIDPPAFPDEDPAMTEKQEFQPLASFGQDDTHWQDFSPEGHDLAPPETEADAPLPFTAPSLARTEAGEADHPANRDTAESTAEPALGELIGRLEVSLERRREQRAREAELAQAQIQAQTIRAVAEMMPEPLAETAPDLPAQPALAEVEQPFEAARPEEAAQAMAAFFGKPAAIPQPREQVISLPDPAWHPLGGLGTDAFDDEDHDDADDGFVPASFSLPLRSAVSDAPAGAADPGQAEALAGQDGDDDFGSLLDLGNPFLARDPAFVRIEDSGDAGLDLPGNEAAAPGIVDRHGGADAADGRAFDRPSGTTPRAPAPEMDAALRSALAKLQRMSGAA